MTPLTVLRQRRERALEAIRRLSGTGLAPSAVRTFRRIARLLKARIDFLEAREGRR
jgi:hypothetical protein